MNFIWVYLPITIALWMYLARGNYLQLREDLYRQQNYDDFQVPKDINPKPSFGTTFALPSLFHEGKKKAYENKKELYGTVNILNKFWTTWFQEILIAP